KRKAFYDPRVQEELDHSKKAKPDAPRFQKDFFDFRGGCTLIVDAETGQVRYCVAKRVTDDDRLAREPEHRTQAGGSLRATYLGADDDNPFPSLHLDD